MAAQIPSGFVLIEMTEKTWASIKEIRKDFFNNS